MTCQPTTDVIDSSVRMQKQEMSQHNIQEQLPKLKPANYCTLRIGQCYILAADHNKISLTCCTHAAVHIDDNADYLKSYKLIVKCFMVTLSYVFDIIYYFGLIIV